MLLAIKLKKLWMEVLQWEYEFKIYGFTAQGFIPSIYNIILLQRNIMSFWLLLKRAPFTGQSVGGGVLVGSCQYL